MKDKPSKLQELNGSSFVGETVTNLLQLSKLGIPRTDAELTERINLYFQFCVQTNTKPGVESLALSLSTSRQNLNNWCHGLGGKSEEWVNQCLLAKQIIVSFLESASLSGKINPATSIFLLKNWASYRDSVEVEHISQKRSDSNFENIKKYRLESEDS